MNPGIFENCKSLKNIDLSATSITKLGDKCFEGCELLEEVELPINSLTTISRNSFYNCSKLRSLKFPKSVTKIEQRAFGFTNSFGFQLFLQYDGSLEEFNSIQKFSTITNGWYQNIRIILKASDGMYVFN